MTHQPNKDRQSGRISGSPSIGALFVNGHIPDGGRVGAPFSFSQRGIVELIEPTAIFFEHENVPIAISGFWITFDERVGRNWLGARITFIEESSKGDWHLGLSSSHYLIGNADCLIVKCAGAEIRMEGYGRANEVDVICGFRVDRRRGNVSIPQTGGLKRHKTIQAGELTDRHPAATSSLRKCGPAKQK